jgi:hypothetical protein
VWTLGNVKAGQLSYPLGSTWFLSVGWLGSLP